MLKQIIKFKEAILYSTLIFVSFVWLLMQIIPQFSTLLRTEKTISKRAVELERVTEKLEKIKKEVASKEKDQNNRIKLIYKPEFRFDTQDMEYLVMVDDIVDIIKDNSLKIYSLDYNYDIAESDYIVGQSGGKYLGCKLKFALIGNYNQIKNMIMDFIKYPYLIIINSIEIEPYSKNEKNLLSVVELTIYSEQ